MIKNKISNIFLTGFMGAGKSTIGKNIAKELNYAFIDLDEIIESKAGKSISEIFQQDGESYFRTLENRVLSDYLGKKNIVVSLGGGTLIDPGNATHVKDSGVLIYLSAEPEELWERVKFTNKRPLLLQPSGDIIPEHDAVKHIKALLSIREKGYKLADTVIPTDKKSIDDILSSILRYLSS
ncbi:shikimate kinase [candidate division KSB1 bacterium]|nr:shikimate kinase [candidate division KSB1 bacterium]